MTEAHDYSALKWLDRELGETIGQARNALQEFVEGAGSKSLMEECASHVHQVHGILQMVQVHGAILLAAEIEISARKLAAGEFEGDEEEFAESVMMGLIRLPDYLEQVQADNLDNPLLLLETLNELRSWRKESPLEDYQLFGPGLKSKLLADDGEGKANAQLPGLAKAVRPRMQRGLLAWIKGTDVADGLDNLQKVMQVLERSAGTGHVKRVFHIVRAALVLPLKDAEGSGTAVKKLFARVDQFIRKIVEGGEPAIVKDFPLELGQRLLYIIGSAEVEDELLEEVRGHYGLAWVARCRIAAGLGGGMRSANREMLSSFKEALGEDLTAIKDKLDLFIRTGSSDPQQLAFLEAPLRTVAGTLGMVGQDNLRKRLIKQAELLKSTAGQGEMPGESELMSMAGDILFVETSLENLSSTVSDSRASEDTLGGEGAGSLEMPSGEYEKLVGTVIQQAAIDMHKCKDAILGYLKSPEEVDLLSQVPVRFSTISGAFEILKLRDASALVKKLAGFVSEQIMHRRVELDKDRMNLFADTVTSIEYFMESMAEGRGVQKDILTFADQSLNNLIEVVGDEDRSQEYAQDRLAVPDVDLEMADVETLTTTVDGTQDAAAATEGDGEGKVLDEVDPEILEIFIEEAREELSVIREFFPRWKNDREDRDALSTFRRSFHTLKGSGRLVGASTIGELAWSVENLLNRIIDQTVQVTNEALDVIGETVGALPALVECLEKGREPKFDVQSLIEKAFALADPDKKPSSGEVPSADDSAHAAAADDAALEDLEPEVPEIAEKQSSKAPSEPPVEAAPAPTPEAAKAATILEDVDPEILDIFIEEAKEELETIGKYYPVWRENQSDKDSLTIFRRSFHTLKGSGRMVGAMTIGELAWSVENLLNRIIDDTVKVSPTIIEVIDETIAHLPHLIDCQEHGKVPNINVQPLIDRGLLLAKPGGEEQVKAEGIPITALVGLAAGAQVAGAESADQAAGDLPDESNLQDQPAESLDEGGDGDGLDDFNDLGGDDELVFEGDDELEGFGEEEITLEGLGEEDDGGLDALADSQGSDDFGELEGLGEDDEADDEITLEGLGEDDDGGLDSLEDSEGSDDFGELEGLGEDDEADGEITLEGLGEDDDESLEASVDLEGSDDFGGLEGLGEADEADDEIKLEGLGEEDDGGLDALADSQGSGDFGELEGLGEDDEGDDEITLEGLGEDDDESLEASVDLEGSDDFGELEGLGEDDEGDAEITLEGLGEDDDGGLDALADSQESGDFVGLEGLGEDDEADGEIKLEGLGEDESLEASVDLEGSDGFGGLEGLGEDDEADGEITLEGLGEDDDESLEASVDLEGLGEDDEADGEITLEGLGEDDDGGLEGLGEDDEADAEIKLEGLGEGESLEASVDLEGAADFGGLEGLGEDDEADGEIKLEGLGEDEDESLEASVDLEGSDGFGGLEGLGEDDEADDEITLEGLGEEDDGGLDALADSEGSDDFGELEGLGEDDEADDEITLKGFEEGDDESLEASVDLEGSDDFGELEGLAEDDEADDEIKLEGLGEDDDESLDASADLEGLGDFGELEGLGEDDEGDGEIKLEGLGEDDDEDLDASVNLEGLDEFGDLDGIDEETINLNELSESLDIADSDSNGLGGFGSFNSLPEADATATGGDDLDGDYSLADLDETVPDALAGLDSLEEGAADDSSAIDLEDGANEAEDVNFFAELDDGLEGESDGEGEEFLISREKKTEQNGEDVAAFEETSSITDFADLMADETASATQLFDFEGEGEVADEPPGEFANADEATLDELDEDFPEEGVFDSGRDTGSDLGDTDGQLEETGGASTADLNAREDWETIASGFESLEDEFEHELTDLVGTQFGELDEPSGFEDGEFLDSEDSPEETATADESEAPPLEIDETLLEIFSAESRNHLETLKGFLQKCEEEGADVVPDEGVTRALHTLRGSAHMADVAPISAVGGALEGYAKALVNHGIAVDRRFLDSLGKGVDAIEAVLSAINTPGATLPDWEELAEAAKKGKEEVIASTEAEGESQPKSSDAEKGESHPKSEAEKAEVGKPEKPPEPTGTATPKAPDPVSETPAPIIVELPKSDGASQRVSADEELIEVFIEEAEELLDSLDNTLNGWTGDGDDRESMSELQRTLHTLKGSSRLAGITAIGDLSHSFESLLIGIRQEKLRRTNEIYELCLKVADRLVRQVEEVRDNRRVTPATVIVAVLDGLIAGTVDGDRLDDYLVESADGGASGAPTPAAASPKSGPKPAPQERPDVPEEVVAIDADPELAEIFQEEAKDLLDSLDQTVHDWGSDVDNLSPLAELQRVLHTLKGSSRLTGITPVGDLSHAFESFLVALKQEEVAMRPEYYTLAQMVTDRLSEQITEVKESGKVSTSNWLARMLEQAQKGEPLDLAPPSHDSTQVVDHGGNQKGDQGKKKKGDAAPDAGQKKGAREQVRVRPELLDRLVNYAGEISIYRARLEEQNSTLGFNLQEMIQTVGRLRNQLRNLEIETEAQILSRYEKDLEERGVAQDKDFDPLEMDQFSTMQQLSRALVETVSDLTSINDALEGMQRDTDTLLLQQSRVSVDLQDGLMRTRMVPFSQTVPRLRRLIRQTCSSQRKRAELAVVGGEAEIDRNILDRVIGPIEHLLRNSVSHGIETPDERIKKGKSDTGTITFTLSREGNDVVIVISDDGAGLNLEKIRAKAIDRGLLAEGAKVSDEDLMQFILEHGFSTASQVDQVAGRGVGMDVVVSEIKQMGGALKIHSEWGKGADFILNLPLTLAVTDSLLMKQGEDIYAVPHIGMEGVVRVSREDLLACYDGRKEGFEYAGNTYVLRYLGGLLGTSAMQLPEQQRWFPVLLVKAGEHRVGLQVDELLGNREVVVKPLGQQLNGLRWLSGGTILADGQVALILDAPAVVRMDAARTVVTKEEAAAKEAAAEPKRPARKKLQVMVVDDSITVRKVTTRFLNRHNMDVVTAKDGVDAVAQLQEIRPDIMLLDVEMPRMDGYELARHVKHSDDLKEIPIIMITSRTGEKHRNVAKELGVERYLGKPYQETELLENIKELTTEAEMQA